MAAPVGVDALNIARNFLQSVRFTPLAIRDIVRASAVGAMCHSIADHTAVNGSHRTFMNYESSKDDQR